MAAISIAVAKQDRAERFLLNDINKPLVELLKEAVNEPQKLIEEYAKVWNEQFAFGENHADHYYFVRDRFNAGEKTATNMLYLTARCVKGAVRYTKDGKFNQGPDNRRHGTNPLRLERNIRDISELLKNKTEFASTDYREVLDEVKTGDLIYLDPPYQGVSNSKDNRYLSGVSFEGLLQALEILNRRSVDFVLSYDGTCGGKEYGLDLPQSFGCKKVMLNAGVSSQSTLLGRKEETVESLYISRTLVSSMP